MPNVNLNQPRSMAGSVERRMPVTTFLRDTLFGEVETYPTEHIDVDVSKGGYPVAPFVAQNVGGVNVGRQGYQTHTYTPPRVAPQRPLSKEVLEERLPGETLHTTRSAEERQDYYLERDNQDLDDSISRREEIMVSSLATNGIIPVRGYIDDKLKNYIEENIDYQYTQKVVLSGERAWNQPTSKKYEDLEAAVETLHQKGYNPELCILGKTARSLFKNDEKFLKMLDIKRLELGMINPELRTVNGSGLLYLGDLPELGLQLCSYIAWYKDEQGVLRPIFPDDHIVITPRNIGKMVYGAITQLEEDKRFHTYEGTRVPKVITNINDDEITYRLSSRPMPRPFDVDSWVSIDVLG